LKSVRSVAVVTLGGGGFGNIRTRSFKICVMTGVLEVYLSLVLFQNKMEKLFVISGNYFLNFYVLCKVKWITLTKCSKLRNDTKAKPTPWFGCCFMCQKISVEGATKFKFAVATKASNISRNMWILNFTDSIFLNYYNISLTRHTARKYIHNQDNLRVIICLTGLTSRISTKNSIQNTVINSNRGILEITVTRDVCRKRAIACVTQIYDVYHPCSFLIKLISHITWVWSGINKSSFNSWRKARRKKWSDLNRKRRKGIVLGKYFVI